MSVDGPSLFLRARVLAVVITILAQRRKGVDCSEGHLTVQRYDAGI